MKYALGTLVLASLVLSGCGGFRRAVGLDRRAPDEFAVVKEAPLVIPPDFTLRPPRAGVPRPQELDAQGQALDVMFGPGSAAAARSLGEQVLLDAAQATKASSDIRSTVRDDGTIVVDKGVFLKEILSTQAGVQSIPDVDIQANTQPKK